MLFRSQRIIISRSQVNAVKWACLILQAICALTAIAMVHSDDRLSAAITMTIFATGIGASVLLIAAHHRPNRRRAGTAARGDARKHPR